MSLADLVAADLDLALDDWGVSAVLRPAGTALSTAAVRLVIGDPAQTVIDVGSGQGAERRAQATGSLAALRAALAAVGHDRAPTRADVVVVAVGEVAGEWQVEAVQTAIGDRCLLSLVEATRRAARSPAIGRGP